MGPGPYIHVLVGGGGHPPLAIHSPGGGDVKHVHSATLTMQPRGAALRFCHQAKKLTRSRSSMVPIAQANLEPQTHHSFEWIGQKKSELLFATMVIPR